MFVVKNINPGLTPNEFGGDANQSRFTTLHGYQSEVPLVFGNNVRPDKNGDETIQNNPVTYQGITYIGLQDTDLPCKGVNNSGLAGMSENLYTQIKQPTDGTSLGGASVSVQPVGSMRGRNIGLSHTQLDIEGQNMRLLPSINAFDHTKPNPLNSDFYA